MVLGRDRHRIERWRSPSQSASSTGQYCSAFDHPRRQGLDAGHVLLFAGHDLDGRGDEEARRLLYIAMTRAREELCVSYYGDSPLMEELRERLR